MSSNFPNIQYSLSKWSLSFSMMKVNYALNHHWCETSLLSQAVLNYMWCPEISLLKNLCNWGISSVSLQEWRNLYGIIVSYQNFFCICIIILCITSACGSQVHGSYVWHYNIWIDQWINKCEPLSTLDLTLMHIYTWEIMRLSR